MIFTLQQFEAKLNVSKSYKEAMQKLIAEKILAPSRDPFYLVRYAESLISTDLTDQEEE